MREVCRIASARTNPLEASYVIVLGGGTKRGGGLGASAKERARAAAFYMADNPACRVVVSGGRGRYGEETEAALLKEYMLSLYVLCDPASGGSAEHYAPRILLEEKSRNTIENIAYSAQVIAEHDNIPLTAAMGLPVVIATSGYHLARSQEIARRLGYTNVSGIAAKTPALSAPKSYIREVLAWVKLDIVTFFVSIQPAARSTAVFR